MKKKLSVFLAVFAAVSLFAFAACNNSSAYDNSALTDRIESLEDQIAQQEETIKNQAAAISALQNSVTALQTAKTKLEEQIASLEDGNSENKTEIQSLKTKVEALETANANFQQQLAALDSSSATFADDLAELTANYNSLAADVQNAAHIERVVVKEEDIKQGNLLEECSLSKLKVNEKFEVHCWIEFSAHLFHHQLLTCKASVNYNDQIFHVNIYLSRADINKNTSTLGGGTETDILVDNVADVTLHLEEVVLYRFN